MWTIPRATPPCGKCSLTRARRAFAVRSGNVDEAKALLRVVGECGELKRILQADLRAEPAQAIKVLDGFGAIHRSVTQRYAQ